MKKIYPLAVCGLIIVLGCACRSVAAGMPENVLVVQNLNSSVSMNIAAYYVSARSIPSENLVSVNTVDSSLSNSNEIISFADYQSKIETPVRDYLLSNNLANVIQYIVLTKGVPHRIRTEVTGGTSGGQSVDSMLATIDLVNPFRVGLVDDNDILVGSPFINRYWRSTQPFSHSKYGGYLVTRLDGYTESDAIALVERAAAATNTPLNVLLDARITPSPIDIAMQPKWIMLPDGSDIDENYELLYRDFDADMVRASQVISDKQFLNTQLDQTNAFVGSADPLTCYISWGSNAGADYSVATYHSLTFGARAIAETAVSSSGRTFLPTTGGQSLIADLISQGAAGAKGYVTEPYLDAIASPTVMLDMYTSGRNLAESFYAASRFVGWKDIVLGDPLCKLDTGVVYPYSYTLSATVHLGDYSASPEGIPVKIDLLTEDGSAILRTENTTLDAQGKFYMHNVEPGTYKVGIKPSHWLRKVTGPVTVEDMDTDFVIN